MEDLLEEKSLTLNTAVTKCWAHKAAKRPRAEPYTKPLYTPCADNSERPVAPKEARDVRDAVRASTPEDDHSAQRAN